MFVLFVLFFLNLISIYTCWFMYSDWCRFHGGSAEAPWKLHGTWNLHQSRERTTLELVSRNCVSLICWDFEFLLLVSWKYKSLFFVDWPMSFSWRFHGGIAIEKPACQCFISSNSCWLKLVHVSSMDFHVDFMEVPWGFRTCFLCLDTVVI